MEGAVGVAVEERFKTGSLFIGGGVWERGEAARGFQDFESLASSSDRGCEGEKGSVVGGFGEEGVLLEVNFGKVVVEAVEGVAKESPGFFGAEGVGGVASSPLTEDHRPDAVEWFGSVEDVPDEVEAKGPEGFGQATGEEVEHALVLEVAQAAALVLRGVSVAHIDPAMNELAPLLLFRGVGEFGAEGFEDLVEGGDVRTVGSI